jgi:hypothetical protein
VRDQYLIQAWNFSATQKGELFPNVLAGIKLFRTIRTDTVAEFGVGVFFYIGFDLIPVSLVIPNFLARRTNIIKNKISVSAEWKKFT